MTRILNRLSGLFITVMVVLVSVGEVTAGGLVDTNFDKNDFNTDSDLITNLWWPLIADTNFLYYAETEDGCVWNLVEALDEVKSDFVSPYDTIEARVVLDRAWESEEDEVCEDFALVSDDDLVELTFDWYAQDKPAIGGNIWYFGEESFDLEDDENCFFAPTTECTAGSWEVGKDVAGTGENARPGIVMLFRPLPGKFYQQEYYADEAEDWGKVLRLNSSISLEEDEYEGCLMTKEWTPLERGEIEHKYYCSEVGLVLIQELKGKTVWVELVDVDVESPDLPQE
jgi:hypothetical protein